MKIVTARKQAEIDKLVKRKLFFLARVIAEKHTGKKLSEKKLAELSSLVEGVFYADEVMETYL